MNLTARAREAVRLYNGLGHAIAAGDKAWFRENAADGLRDRTINLIEKNERRNRVGAMKWEIGNPWLMTSVVPSWPLCSILPTLVRTYKIDSDAVGQIPMSKDTLLRQTVVRINSVQTYDLADGQGEKTKELEEYVVITQHIWEGKEEKWKIWGTLKPATAEEIKKNAAVSRDERKETWVDRFKNRMPNMGTPMV
jgi:hypothetical protein